MSAAEQLVALSRWVDAANAHRDPEALLWHRVGKVSEEVGEAIGALIGATGGNPRKGTSHAMDDVVAELLDVAVAALGAVEHITDHQGLSVLFLQKHLERVTDRALGGVR